MLHQSVQQGAPFVQGEVGFADTGTRHHTQQVIAKVGTPLFHHEEGQEVRSLGGGQSLDGLHGLPVIGATAGHSSGVVARGGVQPAEHRSPKGAHGRPALACGYAVHTQQRHAPTVGRQVLRQAAPGIGCSQQFSIIALGQSLVVDLPYDVEGRTGQFVVPGGLGLFPQSVVFLCHGGPKYEAEQQGENDTFHRRYDSSFFSMKRGIFYESSGAWRSLTLAESPRLPI